MKSKTTLAITSIALAVLLTMSAAGQNPEPGKNRKSKQNHVTSRSGSEQGQQLFNQNCSRCHKAPEAIRPSISATVALHMRIRAGLSEKDYKQLLAFLNP